MAVHHVNGKRTIDLLVVVIPALNEERTIGDVVEAVPRDLSNVGEVCIVVVDDGSTDATAELARASGAIVVRHDVNLGVGAAFATGIDRALRLGADVIVNVDADGQFQPADVPELVRPILEDGYGFVTCTRFGDPALVPKMPWVKKWGNGVVCHIVNTITRHQFTDVSCGFRAYTRETALRLNLFGQFTYTHETFIDLACKRVRMTEVPLKVRGEREFGKSRVAASVWKYAFQTLPIIVRSMRDTRPLLTFGPVALVFLLLGLGSTGFVGGWWLAYGRTSPWSSLVTVGIGSLVLSTIFAVLAMVADQVGRSRRLLEDVLYHERRRAYDEAAMRSSPADELERQTEFGSVADADRGLRT